jgi:F-type H+-transporting ATPase subunit delta
MLILVPLMQNIFPVRVNVLRNLAKRIAKMVLQMGDDLPANVLDAFDELPPRQRIKLLKLLSVALHRLLSYGKALVETAHQLSDAELDELSRKFSIKLGKTVSLQQLEAPQLIGGVRVTIGDQRWERSLHRQLQMFRER